jgi:metallo-beta-lactamase class B
MRRCVFLLLTCVGLLHAFGQSVPAPALIITPVAGNVYAYTTFRQYNGMRASSNSAYVVTPAGVVLLDTPWDPAQFQPLLDSIEARHGQKAVLCIATHAHDDRSAGLGFLASKGVATYSSAYTDSISRQRGEQRAQYHFTRDTVFRLGGQVFQTYYGGKGHAEDNIVVWLPVQRVLYGGCVVKSARSTSLGNTADASLHDWARTLRNIRSRFPRAAFLVPGHGEGFSPDALEHTLSLLEAIKK